MSWRTRNLLAGTAGLALAGAGALTVAHASSDVPAPAPSPTATTPTQDPQAARLSTELDALLSRLAGLEQAVAASGQTPVPVVAPAAAGTAGTRSTSPDEDSPSPLAQAPSAHESTEAAHEAAEPAHEESEHEDGEHEDGEHEDRTQPEPEHTEEAQHG